MHPNRTPSRRLQGFTLIELVAVIVLLSIVAVTVTPALNTVSSTRDTALANELERRLSLARAWAASTGQPAGVRFDVLNQRVSAVRIVASGSGATPLPSATGSAPSSSADDVPALVAGTRLVGLTVSPAGYDTIWFDFVGRPHVRNASGAFVQNIASDAVVTTSGSRTVTIRRFTGLIEK